MINTRSMVNRNFSKLSYEELEIGFKTKCVECLEQQSKILDLENHLALALAELDSINAYS